MKKVPNAYKIALPTPSFLPAIGGAEVGLHNIAKTLKAKGHEPYIITSFKHAMSLRRMEAPPYTVLYYPPKLLTAYGSLNGPGNQLTHLFHYYLQKRFRFDFWHATFGFPVGTAVIQFCKKNGLSHLVRCVGEDIQIDSSIKYGMRLNARVDRHIRSWLPRADNLVATTETMIAEYQDIGVADDKILSIPNGIELSRFRNHKIGVCLKQKLKLRKDAFLFLAVGRYHKKKNFEQLIRVFQRLADESPQSFFLAICGVNVGALQAQIDESALDKSIFLIEPIVNDLSGCLFEFPTNEVLDWYHSADCFLMPSTVESFGIVTIEAMASGLPVIAADSPGTRDVLRNGQDGVMYDGSDENLTFEIKKILTSVNYRKANVAKSLIRSQQFDWLDIVDTYIEHYEFAIESRQYER